MWKIFYGDEDRKDIRTWIKIADDRLEKQLLDFIARQLKQYDTELTSQLDMRFNKESAKIKRECILPATPTSEVADLAREVETLKSQLAALAGEIETLKVQLAAKDTSPAVAALAREIETLKAQLAAKDTSPAVAALTREIETLKAQLAAKDTSPAVEEPKPQVSKPEEIFYLPNQEEVFLPNDPQKILSLIRQASDVTALKNFLLANPSVTSAKFQKLLNSHLNDVQKFASKLKLSDLDEEELSEVVTAKYFKLFQRIIFDNFIVAIKRGLNNDTDKFYAQFLAKLNEYLTRCGIYTVNVISARKVSDDDYKNMTPQVIKTPDKDLNGYIKEIERLPYRINYITEMGDKDFLQYNGIMLLYKAV